MKRRQYLRAVAGVPIFASGVAGADETNLPNQVAGGYFDSLPKTKAARNDTIVKCANELCAARKTVSQDVLTAVADGEGATTDVVRRLEYGVRILNEFNITNKIDPSMIRRGRRSLSDYSRFLPLVGSFNNLCDAACAVQTPDPNPKRVKDFLAAAAAFGLEVALWTLGTPYKMAWSGTRFVANRTFLRFARYGCRGCIAILMSELHWAIRGSVYGKVVTEDNIEFIVKQIEQLKTSAMQWNYSVDLDFSSGEIRRLVESRGGGVIGGGSGGAEKFH